MAGNFGSCTSTVLTGEGKMSVASRFKRDPAFAWFWELLTKVYRLDHARLRIMTRWEALIIFWDLLVIFGLKFPLGKRIWVRDERFFPEFKVDTLG